MTAPSRQPVITLSGAFLRSAVRRVDLTIGTGRASARLLVAVELGRTLEAEALIAACRQGGIRHVCTGPAAAHALAALAIPALPEVEGRH